jgi:hypothetical protein
LSAFTSLVILPCPNDEIPAIESPDTLELLPMDQIFHPFVFSRGQWNSIGEFVDDLFFGRHPLIMVGQTVWSTIITHWIGVRSLAV